MFRATMSPSSGEKLFFSTLGTCYSVWMTVKYAGTKCRINTVASPDDGHIVTQNMSRLINILRINILRINHAPSWLYLLDYKGCTVNKT